MSFFHHCREKNESDSGPTERAVRRKISAGQEALRHIRWRVTGALLVIGAFLAVAYEYAVFQRSILYKQDTCACTFETHFWMMMVEVTFFGRLLAWSIAPLATDIWCTRLCLLFDSGLWLTSASVIVIVARPSEDEPEARKLLQYFGIANFLVAIGFFSGSIFVCYLPNARKMQTGMWNLIGCILVLYVPGRFCMASAMAYICQDVSDEFWGVVAGLTTLFFVWRADLRRALQAQLCRMWDAKCGQRAAAGVAGLVGNCSSKRALADAASRFRSIRLCDLEYADIADNKPKPELFSLTKQCRLGHCDAFLSHAWRDDPQRKWLALQRWREAFVKDHGREPRVWFDKCCIDQNRIEMDLRCLPVFLSGCNSLVVLCGPMYLSRLWCIMEIFTFVHMHRGMEHIKFVNVASDSLDNGTEKAVMLGCDTFDAASCDCSAHEDKVMIHDIIRAAYGNIYGFNLVVRSIFREAGFIDPKARDLESASESGSDYSTP